MAGTRLNLDLFIPDKTPAQVAAQYPVILNGIRQLKALAVKINAGKPNEEATVTARYHLCRNDESKPCEADHEI